MQTKKCNRCKSEKPLSEFYHHKTGVDAGKPLSQCKTCHKELSQNWRAANYEKSKRISQNYKRKMGRLPMNENKGCSTFLGVWVAERVLENYFEHTQRMPPHNPGFDFICGKGFKIDVKSSCERFDYWHNAIRARYWSFITKRNPVADYFLCLAFDNRDSLIPQHIWLIPAILVLGKTKFTISNSKKGLIKWAEYEQPIEKVKLECNSTRIKNGQNE